MIPFLTVLDKCQYIASFWMLFSIWERPCVQKEMIKPNSKYVHITGYSWIKYQEKIYSLGDHSGNGKVTILRRQKKLLKFWEDGHGQYILTETIVESLMSIQWRVLKYWADIFYVPSMKISYGHLLFFSALWSVPVFIEVDFCQQRRYHEIEQKKIFPCTSSDPLPCDLSVYRGHLKEIYREVQTLVGKGRKSNLFLSASELMLKTHGVCPFSCIVCT